MSAIGVPISNEELNQSPVQRNVTFNGNDYVAKTEQKSSDSFSLSGIKPSSENIMDEIGNTPLIPLKILPYKEGIACKVFVKCEFMNPSGSIYDRVALGIMNKLDSLQLLYPGVVLISASNPDLSISIAMIAALKGRKSISILPLKTNERKRAALIGLGSKISLIPEISLDPEGTEVGNALAEEFVTQLPNTINLCPYITDSQIYFEGITQEILKKGLRPDIFVCSLDIERSLSGVAKKLKDANAECLVIGVQVSDDSEQITAMGKPDALQITNISEKESLAMTRRLIQEEGILCGPKGGAVVAAAFKKIKESGINDDDAVMVVICISESLNYCDKEFLHDDWMLKQGYFSEKDIHLRFWWYGISIGNLMLKSPPAITKDRTVGAVVQMLKDVDAPMLVILDLTTINCKNHIAGVITRKLIRDLEMGKFTENQTLEDAEGSFLRDFGQISRNATLGDLEEMLKEYEIAVVYNVTSKSVGDDYFVNFRLPTGVATVIDIIKWTYETMDHHRKNLTTLNVSDVFEEASISIPPQSQQQ